MGCNDCATNMHIYVDTYIPYSPKCQPNFPWGATTSKSACLGGCEYWGRFVWAVCEGLWLQELRSTSGAHMRVNHNRMIM
jgi:hypothetical protein